MSKLIRFSGLAALLTAVCIANGSVQASTYGHGILQADPYVQGDVRANPAANTATGTTLTATTASSTATQNPQPVTPRTNSAAVTGSYGYQAPRRAQNASQTNIGNSANGASINLDAAAAESERASVYAPY